MLRCFPFVNSCRLLAVINQNIQSIRPITIILMMIAIGVIPQFASDNFLPSLPGIARYFSIDSNVAQWTILIYLLSLSVSQLFYGILSDTFGRKPVLLLGFVIFTLASLLCIFSQNITMLLIGRFIQGCGMGSYCLFRVILRDRFSGKELAKFTSYVMPVVSITPAFAPISGGYIAHYLGWHYSFVLVAILGLVTTAALWWRCPETLPIEHRKQFSFSNILATIHNVLWNKKFLINTICAGFASLSI